MPLYFINLWLTVTDSHFVHINTTHTSFVPTLPLILLNHHLTWILRGRAQLEFAPAAVVFSSWAAPVTNRHVLPVCKLRTGSCSGTRCTSSPLRPGSCPQPRVLARSSVLGSSARPPPPRHAIFLARDAFTEWRTNSPIYHQSVTDPQLSRAIRSVTNSIF